MLCAKPGKRVSGTQCGPAATRTSSFFMMTRSLTAYTRGCITSSFTARIMFNRHFWLPPDSLIYARDPRSVTKDIYRGGFVGIWLIRVFVGPPSNHRSYRQYYDGQNQEG